MQSKKARYLFFAGALSVLALFLIRSDLLLKATDDALHMVVKSILPSLFPYLVLSHILTAATAGISLPFGRVFSWLFRLPEIGLLPFFLGAICGFPIGAKTVAELYDNGCLTREEAARLAALSGNCGPAFAVAVIGGALYHNIALGWGLYALQILLSVLLGMLSARRYPAKASCLPPPSPPSFSSLGSAFYEASLSMLGIVGTVVFFSAASSFLGSFLPPFLAAFLTAFLEVGSAAVVSAAMPYELGIPLIAFSLSFSGFSVLLQSSLFLAPRSIPIAPLYKRKLLGGILAMGCALLLF